MKVSQICDEMADREAIRDCLFRYARGTDRMDKEAFHSAFWPDGTVEQVGFSGTAAEYIDHTLAVVAGMDQTMHLFGNILITIAGENATAESYVYAYHRLRANGEQRNDLIVGARYFDRLQQRDDEWRISKRVLIIDWYRHFQDSADWGAGLFGMQCKFGGRKPDDVSYDMLLGERENR